MWLTEFLVTSFIVVLMPGTGVLYTVSTGLTRGWRASLFAACGCTLGIVPHLLASMFGLAAVLHTSALAFQVFKLLGVLYLAYLAWSMWKESGSIQFDHARHKENYLRIALRAFFINILNPKLSIFFLAFLPQFIPSGIESAFVHLFTLGAIFMMMTLVVFMAYGVLAHQVRFYVTRSPASIQRLQKIFAGLFVVMGLKLASLER